MKGVILAAGSGHRLSSYSGRRPKSLLSVAGRPIIDYTLEAFGNSGVTDVAIVIGYRGNALRDWIGEGDRHGLRVQYIYNPEYQRGNALSVYAARSFTEDGPFLLAMADHMISRSLLGRLLSSGETTNALAVDFDISPHHADEATRVMVDRRGLVIRIGKDLSRWNGVDAGMFRLTDTVFKALGQVIDEGGPECGLSEAITRMIDLGHPLEACDISGCFWQDIDTWEDLHLARQTLAV